MTPLPPSRVCETCSSSRIIASGPKAGSLACFVFGVRKLGEFCQFYTPEIEAFRFHDAERGEGFSSCSASTTATNSTRVENTDHV
jgi:hypothetical protein